MATIDVPAHRLTDLLRSDLIFLPDDGTCVCDDDAIAIRTPSNPTYWWGNYLHCPAPPGAGDRERWLDLFARRIRAFEPASTHTTFAWDGLEAGDVEPFRAMGFAHFDGIAMAVDRPCVVTAPHPADVEVRPIAGTGWASLHALLVATRDANQHSEAGYAPFAWKRIAAWRALEERGQGGWFCIVDAGTVVAALGVFAEAARGPDGRRIGRFQHVVTAPDVRRRGYAGTLVAHASRHAFDVLDADTLVIYADANDVARRVYESCGYRIRSRHHGLERGS